MLCRCTTDHAADCAGGGLPPTGHGECSCACHRPVLRERWPLRTPAPASTGLAVRERVYLLALHAPTQQHPQLAVDVCALLAGLAPRDAAVAARVLGDVGLAPHLVASLLRTALVWARARVTAGILAVGGVP